MLSVHASIWSRYILAQVNCNDDREGRAGNDDDDVGEEEDDDDVGEEEEETDSEATSASFPWV